MSRIFQDDPDAIQKLEVKLAKLEEQKAYWKTIKKCVPRTYDNTPEDARWYMLDNVSTNIRMVKKKIEQIQARKDQGKELKRQTTFKDGRKVFFYTEVDKQ